MDARRKTYEEELPAGYREAMTVDAKDKRTMLLMNLTAAAIAAALITAVWRACGTETILDGLENAPWKPLAACAAMIAYIILHELTHGAVYHFLTGRRLTYGFTVTVAYCGVPDVYVYRATALAALLAPFVVFGIVFGAPALALPAAFDRFLCGVLLAVHVCGCVGDLYDTALYLFRFRDGGTLMRDSGPAQTFYVR